MSALTLIALALFFGFLAHDARKLSVPAKAVPYSVTAEGLGQDVSGIPLHEQDKRKRWNIGYGLGDLNQAVWLWGILSVSCTIGAIVIAVS